MTYFIKKATCSKTGKSYYDSPYSKYLDDDDIYIDDHVQMVKKLLDDIIMSSIQKAQSREVSKLIFIS